MSKINSDILNDFRKVGILGLGLTGSSAYKFFKNYDIQTVLWDDSNLKRQDFLKNFPGSDLVQYDQWQDCSHILISPGIPLSYPKKHPVLTLAETHNIKITSDNEILYFLKKGYSKFVGITGTNGKSTTTAMIGHVLVKNNYNVSVGGNIGISAFDLDFNSDIYVLELSSFQLELINNFKCDVAVFLNITPDHLDRHGNMENYAKAKSRIFANQTGEDFTILGIDNPITSWIYEEQKAKRNSKVIGVSGASSFMTNSGIICFDNDVITDNFWSEEHNISNNVYLQGKHNRANFAACYAACMALGAMPERIVKTISSFVGLSHRMEYIGSINNVSFYNDSKATNADASKPALESLSNIYWLAGGIPKKGGIDSLLDNLTNVKKAYLFGEAAGEFAITLNHAIPYEIFIDMNSAALRAYEDASYDVSKSNILLSPACASFDQFKNFEDRGEHFKKIYYNLKIIDDE